ncbi:MAG: hypothetical protein ACXAAM_08410, partial [Candidatus Heimdallarchaeaceae archaeon]
SSGKRSAILFSDNKFFKYKGICPISKEFWSRGEPVGGMTQKSSIKEMEINEIVNKKYEEYDYESPIKPAAQVRLDVEFNNERVFANINEIAGDTRLNMIVSRSLIKNDTKKLRELSKSIYAWKGFSDRILKETGVKLYPMDDDLTNTVIYNLHDGFGVAKIDYELTEISKDTGWNNPSQLNQLNILPFNTILKEVSKKTNQTLGEYDFFSATVEEIDDDNERIEYENKERIFYINKNRFKLMEEMKKEYYKTYDGEELPKPINEKIIKWFLS